MKSADAPSMIADRYRRGEIIANLLPGATVFAAQDDILDRQVLVVLPEVADIPSVLDGARRAALVNEPALVKILDVGEDASVSYIVTEAPAGVSLTQLVARGPLDGGAARSVVGPLAEAIDIARRRGVHHGDIRPSVVFVGPNGPQLFGLGFAGALAQGAGTRPVVEADAADRDDTRGLVEVLYFTVTSGEAGTPVVAARALNESVPADIDTIITATLIEQTGSRHPQELATALAPWRTDDLTTALQSAGLGDTAAAAAAGTALVAPLAGFQRTSVKSSTSRMPAAAAGPGTPPPAPHGRVHRWGGVGAGAAAGIAGAAAVAGAGTRVADAGTATAPAGAAPLPPSFPPASVAGAGPAGPVSQDDAPASPPVEYGPTSNAPGVFRPISAVTQNATAHAVASDLRDVKQRAGRFRFNPTPIILVITIAALGWASLWAFTSLTNGLGPLMSSAPQSPRPTVAPTPDATGPGSATTAPPAAFDPPVIASAKQLDPDGDDNEHPELVDRAFDQDLQSFWTTRTYGSANFGGIAKRGIGYAITLEQATQVSKMYLTTDSTGGKFEVRDTTSADPTGGTLLASGSFNEDFIVKLSKPVVTDHLVLWITSLPKDADGKFVLRLFEVSLS